MWFERWNELFFSWVPYQHRPLEWIAAQQRSVVPVPSQGDTQVVQNPIVQQSPNHNIVSEGGASAGRSGATSLPVLPRDDVDVTSFVSTRKEVIVRVVSDVSLFLTYGLLFPPLAIIIVFSLAVETRMIEHQWARITRLLQMCPSATEWHQQVTVLGKDCLRFRRGVFPALRRLDVMASLFWSFTLFDTLGGSVGAVRAIWIAVVMCTSPGWLWCIQEAINRCSMTSFIRSHCTVVSHVVSGTPSTSVPETSEVGGATAARRPSRARTYSTREDEKMDDHVDHRAKSSSGFGHTVRRVDDTMSAAVSSGGVRRTSRARTYSTRDEFEGLDVEMAAQSLPSQW